MKSLIQTVKNWVKSRPHYPTFEEMPDRLLFVLFILAALPACHYGYILSQTYGPYVEAFNQAGMTGKGLLATFLMAGLALQTLFLTWTAKRTGDLLYKRWFK